MAADVSRVPNDRGHLGPMTKMTRDNCGMIPGRVSGDGSYYSREGVAVVEEMGAEAYVPVTEPGQAKVEWGEEAGAYRCMMGHWLDRRGCGEGG